MHELALVQEMLEIINQAAALHKLKKVTEITVEIGVLANVVPETLAFAFEALTEGTIYEEAKLIMEEVPVHAQCQNCRHDYTSLKTPLICPQCQSSQATIMAGTELTIANLVGEEQDDY